MEDESGFFHKTRDGEHLTEILLLAKLIYL